MQTDKIAVALRVLNAIARDRSPVPEDIVLLKSWVGQDDQLLPPDDFAHLVMNRELGSSLKTF